MKYKWQLILVAYSLLTIPVEGENASKGDSLRAEAMMQAANKAYRSKDYKNAIARAKEAGELFQKNAYLKRYISARHLSALSHSRQKSYEEAGLIYRQLLTTLTSKLPADDTLWINFYIARGKFQHRNKFPKLAISDLQEAIDRIISLKGNDHPSLISTYETLRRAYLNDGNRWKSIQTEKRSLRVKKARLAETDFSIIKSYGQISMSYLSLHLIKASQAYADTALFLANQSREEKDRKLAMVYNVLSIIFSSLGNTEKNIEYGLKSLKLAIQRHGPDHKSLIDIYRNLSYASSEPDKPGKSLAYTREELRITLLHHGESNPQTGKSYLNYANLLLLAGAFDSCYYYTRKGEQVLLSFLAPDHPAHSIAHKGWGKYYSAKKAYTSSIRHFRKACRLTQFSDFYVSEYFTNALYMGKDLRQAGYPDSALATYQTLIRKLVPGFESNDYRDNPSLNVVSNVNFLLNILNRKAEVLHFMSKNDHPHYLVHARHTYKRAADLVDTLRRDMDNYANNKTVYRQIQQTFEGTLATTFELYQQTHEPRYLAESFQMMERSRSFQLKKAIAAAGSFQFAGVPDSILQREKQLRSAQAIYTRQVREAHEKNDTLERSASSDRLFSAKSQYYALQNHIRENYPKYFQLQFQVDGSDLSTLQQQLSSGEAIMAYFLGDTSLFVWTLSPSQVIFYRDTIGEKFHEHVAMLRSSISDPAQRLLDPRQSFENYITAATYLYDRLFPQESRKILTDIAAITLIPDNTLNLIPFEALLTAAPAPGENDYRKLPYLLHEKQIHYAYSTWLDRYPTTANRAAKSYAGFAPTYDMGALAAASALDKFAQFRSNARPLLKNSVEVKSVNRLLGGMAYLGPDASEANFKAMAGDYRVLHLAMHALTDDEEPMLSKLLFTQTHDTLNDGYLNVYELYNMDLDADLVVLSACNTGYGKLIGGEGPMSLARAFRYAGCPAVVMSLWQAEDRSSARLMQTFFEGISREENKSLALSQAKKTFLSHADPVKAHPFYWANFVVIGNREPVQFGNSWRSYGYFAGAFFILGSLGFLLGRRFWLKRYQMI